MSKLFIESVVAVAVLTACAQGVGLRTVALQGQPAPGTGGAGFLVLRMPVLNAAGQTAFSAEFSGLGSTEGIWLEKNGSLDLIAKSGDQPPGTPSGVSFRGFSTPHLNSHGQFTFIGTLMGNDVTAINDQGIWSDRSGSVALVVREGEQAPGTPAGTVFSFTSFSGPIFNSAGQTAFSARLEGSGITNANNAGMWSDRGGSLALIARAGDHAPGTPDGVNFFEENAAPVLNAAGQTAFTYRILGAMYPATQGIWSERNGALDLVVQIGDPAPGMPGVNFTGLSNYKVGIDADGHIAFKAYLEGNGTQGWSIWSDRSGALDLIVQQGESAPGAPPDFEFVEFLEYPLMNSQGQIAFRAHISDVPVNRRDDSIWKEDDGVLSLVARAGEHAPGAPDDIIFFGFNSPVLNSAGQVAFMGGVFRSGQSRSNHSGIWAQDAAGNLQLIVRVGDILEVAPNDFRTVSSLGFAGGSSNNNGVPSGFNDRGQVAFHAWFTNGTNGIFVSDLAAIPEPSTLIVLASVSLAILKVRSRRLE
jgi:hypothetical protein